MLAGECIPNRSNFLKGSVGLVFGLSSLTVLPGSVAGAENGKNRNVLRSQRNESHYRATASTRLAYISLLI